MRQYVAINQDETRLIFEWEISQLSLRGYGAVEHWSSVSSRGKIDELCVWGLQVGSIRVYYQRPAIVDTRNSECWLYLECQHSLLRESMIADKALTDPYLADLLHRLLTQIDSCCNRFTICKGSNKSNKAIFRLTKSEKSIC